MKGIIMNANSTRVGNVARALGRAQRERFQKSGKTAEQFLQDELETQIQSAIHDLSELSCDLYLEENPRR
jgi:hypothetical protein